MGFYFFIEMGLTLSIVHAPIRFQQCRLHARIHTHHASRLLTFFFTIIVMIVIISTSVVNITLDAF